MQTMDNIPLWKLYKYWPYYEKEDIDTKKHASLVGNLYGLKMAIEVGSNLKWRPIFHGFFF